jgi:DNA-binding IclR family transcriptional regulator
MGGATLTELAREIDMPTSTAHNYLKTLEEEEYVVEEDGMYRVGLRFLEHGAHARDQQKLYRTAKPEIDKLADETGELGNLLVEEHDRGVYLHRVRGDDAVRVQATVGTRVFLHSTGLGKVILAHMSPNGRPRLSLTGTNSRTDSNRSASADTPSTTRSGPRGYDVWQSQFWITIGELSVPPASQARPTDCVATDSKRPSPRNCSKSGTSSNSTTLTPDSDGNRSTSIRPQFGVPNATVGPSPSNRCVFTHFPVQTELVSSNTEPGI